jgi:hypothetical protein
LDVSTETSYSDQGNIMDREPARCCPGCLHVPKRERKIHRPTLALLLLKGYYRLISLALNVSYTGIPAETGEDGTSS